MDSFQIEIRERLTRIEALLEERLSAINARLDRLELSNARSGERIGELEKLEQRRKGGMAVMAVLGAAAGSAGAVLVKLFWQGGQ